MYQRSAYETIKRATTRKILPYDLTYSITSQFGSDALFSLFLSWRAHKGTRIRRHRVCPIATIFALSVHHYGIQRAIDRAVGDGKRIEKQINIGFFEKSRKRCKKR